MAKAARAELSETPPSDGSALLPPDKPRIVAKPPPDPSQPIELTALFLDRPYGLNQVANVIRVGSAVQNGIGVGGLCESITQYPNGAIVVAVRKSGAVSMTAEDKAKFPMQYLTFLEGFGEVA